MRQELFEKSNEDILKDVTKQTFTEMDVNMSFDIVIQFAVLWGENIGSAMTEEEFEEAKVMKEYDSIELFELLVKWKDAYLRQDAIEDSCEFFEMKRKELVKKDKEAHENS